MRLHNIKQPASGKALAHLEVEGQRLDLHAALQLVGLNYGIDPTSVTMGWVATEPRQVAREGRLANLSGLVMHFDELQLFELALRQAEIGALEYFELREDPRPMWMFFFEGGTVRLSAGLCRADLLLDDDGDDGHDGGGEDGDDLPILQ